MRANAWEGWERHAPRRQGFDAELHGARTLGREVGEARGSD